jgi:hypothetical protein
MKMAEMFLTGAQVHQHYLKQEPIYQPLQDELEAGLGRLRSTLQAFFK